MTAMTAMREAAAMTAEELAQILDFADIINGFVRSVRSEGFKRANRKTGSIPGYKLVPGKSDRDWKVPEDAATALVIDFGLDEDALYTRSLKSPAQVEAILKTQIRSLPLKERKAILDKFGKLFTKKAGTTSLAREFDGRDEVKRGHEFKGLVDKLAKNANPDRNEKVEDLL